jgi:hypothetical protein
MKPIVTVWHWAGANF